MHGCRRMVRPIVAGLSIGGLVLGCSSPDESPAPPTVEGALQIVGTDRLTFEPSELVAAAGEITIELTSQAGVAHDVVIDETDERVVSAGAGRIAVGTVTLEPGSYTFFCSVPGHRASGMEGVLTIEL